MFQARHLLFNLQRSESGWLPCGVTGEAVLIAAATSFR
jgi:hypothetical protein